MAQVVNPTVDDIVKYTTYYENICEEQLAVLRQHLEESKKEFALYSRCHQTWKAAPGYRDAYIAEMERRCEIVPQTIAEQVFYDPRFKPVQTDNLHASAV